MAQWQYLPRALIRIHTTSVDTVRGEKDLQEKPLQDLIAKLQEDNPFVAKKQAALQAWLTCRKDQVTEQGQWHFWEDRLLYHLYQLYIPDNEALQSELFTCFHEDPLAGYFGKKRTLELIQRHYHWP